MLVLCQGVSTDFHLNYRKTLHMMHKRRFRKSIQTELEFVEFESPFLKKLRSDNRWVMLASRIPWEKFESDYLEQFSEDGNDALPFRVALGSLIIKEMLQLTDRDTALQIQENPYLQYFLGFDNYRDEEPFDHSLMTHFRKRISRELLARMNEQIVFGSESETKTEQPDKDDDQNNTPTGKLVIDATCAPEDMKYPTDLGVLNDAREITEKVIDTLWISLPCKRRQDRRKPRTYRRKARAAYLSVIRQKKPKYAVLRRGIRRQIGFLARNQSTIARMNKEGAALTVLGKRLYRKMLVSAEVLRQQREMFPLIGKKGHRIDDRIVSISKPHVRPIVRGKASAAVEFGSKLSASVIDGYFFIDRLSWDAFNECGDLQTQAERYRERTGHYPASIHADKIYRTRDNHNWCKTQGIRLSGPPLGRPDSDEAKNKERRKQLRLDELDRIIVEARFGNGKRRFSMGHLMTKLRETSETVVGLIALVMNLGKILRDLLLSFFKMLLNIFVMDDVVNTPALEC